MPKTAKYKTSSILQWNTNAFEHNLQFSGPAINLHKYQKGSAQLRWHRFHQTQEPFVNATNDRMESEIWYSTVVCCSGMSLSQRVVE